MQVWILLYQYKGNQFFNILYREKAYLNKILLPFRIALKTQLVRIANTVQKASTGIPYMANVSHVLVPQRTETFHANVIVYIKEASNAYAKRVTLVPNVIHVNLVISATQNKKVEVVNHAIAINMEALVMNVIRNRDNATVDQECWEKIVRYVRILDMLCNLTDVNVSSYYNFVNVKVF